MDDKQLYETLADAVMARPREFFVNNRRFCMWSPTLGMTILIERHIAVLGIDHMMLERNPSLEALRLATEKNEEVCYILSILTHRRFSDFYNSRKLKRRAEYFMRHLSHEELAKLILIALSDTKAESLIVALGLDKEHKRQAEIAKYKNRDGHSATFGGKTMFGSIIGVACEKYGCTKKYAVWGIDLLSLRMMLADAINTVYLSDEDMKALGKQLAETERKVYGMTPDDIAALKSQFSE